MSTPLKIASVFLVLAMVSACGGRSRTANKPLLDGNADEEWFCQVAEDQVNWDCVRSDAMAASPQPARLPTPREVPSPDPDQTTGVPAPDGPGISPAYVPVPPAPAPAAEPTPSSEAPPLVASSSTQPPLAEGDAPDTPAAGASGLDPEAESGPVDGQEPSESVDGQEPSESVDGQEPSESVDGQEPSESVDGSPPSESVDGLPSESVDGSPPPERGTDQQAERGDQAIAFEELPDRFFTIQIVAMDDAITLGRFLADRQLYDLSSARVAAEGQIYYVLLMGVFEDEATAEAAASAMPDELQDFQPWVRSLRSLKAAMREADQLSPNSPGSL